MTLTATSQLAIQKALEQDWKTAVKINQELLKKNKKDIDALNRLGFAYTKTGNVNKAKQTFESVLKLDKYNSIAQKNLNKLSSVKQKDLKASGDSYAEPLSFLQEPGKTKVIPCIKLASANVLGSASSGQKVILKDRKRCIEVRDVNNNYLGALPDDVSFQFSKFLNGGNRYDTIIRNVDKQSLTVFIREISRGKEFSGQPSFLSKPLTVSRKRSGKTITTAAKKKRAKTSKK